jgi:NTP pyrophosphatase (non-canonical NTP hydrolase)
MTSLQELQVEIYETNKANGFHEEGDRLRLARFGTGEGVHESDAGDDKALQNYYAKRIFLVVTELSEALEELRAGHAVDHEYEQVQIPQSLVAEIGDVAKARQVYLDNGGRAKLEGVPIELADAMIRLLDIFEEIGIDAEDVIRRKLAFNKTRGYKHGGRAF